MQSFQGGHDALTGVVVTDYDHDGVQEIIVAGRRGGAAGDAAD